MQRFLDTRRSIIDAVYHGVPVIGLPFVTDQQNNMVKSVRDGYAVQLDWSLHDPK